MSKIKSATSISVDAMTPWDAADLAFANGTGHLMIWGPPGTAKSYYAVQVFKRASGADHIAQVTLNEDIAVQEVMGTFMPAVKDHHQVWNWHTGPMLGSFSNGSPLIINELGRSAGSVQDFCLGILDSSEVARITLPTGETILRHKDFRVIATSNSSPDQLSDALRDRFDTCIHVTHPHPHLIAFLNAGFPGLGNIIHESFNTGRPADTISPRRGIAFNDYVRAGVDPSVAAKLAFGARHEDILAAVKLQAA